MGRMTLVHKQSPGPNINCAPICLLPGAPEPTDTSHKDTKKLMTAKA